MVTRSPSRSDTGGAAGRLMRSFVESLPDYAIVLLSADGTIRAANQGATALLGHTEQELAGRPVADLFLPDDAAAGKPERMLAAARAGRFEDVGPLRRRDGRRFTADILVRPIVAARGRTAGFGMILRDVSTLVAASAERQAGDARLQSLVDTVLDTLVDGLIIIDRHGCVQLCNRACERLFGYAPSEMLGCNVKMLMPAAMAGKSDATLANDHRAGIRDFIGISREVMGLRRDGSRFPLHLAVGETSHRGEPVYVGIIRDLTERNRTEEQLRQAQKMEAVGQLTGGIAHDFNNILMIIMANTDALLEESGLALDPRARLEQIDHATQRASDLTRQLLAFSRKQPLRPQPTDLNGLVDTTSRLLRRTLGENVEIRLERLDGLWTVSVDRAQLESALVNLCLNARDAMPEGGRLTIETRNVVLDADAVEAHPETVPGSYVMLSVADQGVGMAPEVLARVFEPFFTTKEVGKGTVLGLSMVYDFIRQSNGHVWIDSTPGEGTTVRLYLPRHDAPALPESRNRRLVAPRGRGRVLVVEDDAQVRSGVVEQLRSLGYEVSEAAAGEQGLAAFAAASPPFDLLLTDIVMPGPVGGKALAAEVRRRSPRTPVILMSADADEAARQPEKLEPGQHLLEKPFRKRDLALLIRTILDRTG